MVDVKKPNRCSGVDTGSHLPSPGHSTEPASVEIAMEHPRVKTIRLGQRERREDLHGRARRVRGLSQDLSRPLI